MTDKTTMYILIIVGIVALVALVHAVSGSQGNAAMSGITGNVVAEDYGYESNDGSGSSGSFDFTGVGRFIFGATLLGISVYMYTKHE